MSNNGLRQANWFAGQLSEQLGADMRRSVIVNKVSWFGLAGIKKKHAEDVLGDYLGGFVPDSFNDVRTAQNQGILLSKVKSNNPVEVALRKILRGK
jgi:hypothetical protein